MTVYSQEPYLDALPDVDKIQELFDLLGLTPAVSELLLKSRPEGESAPHLDNISNYRVVKESLPEAWILPTAHHDRTKKRLIAALNAPQNTYEPKRKFNRLRKAWQIGQCNATFAVLNHGPLDKADWLVLPLTCNSIACPYCARFRSMKRAERAASIHGLAFLDLRWITFTVRNCAMGDLSAHFDKLKAAFSHLRRAQSGPEWSDHVRGYLFGFEVTHNAHANTWHLHIHVLYDGDFWPMAALNGVWKKRCANQGLVGHAVIGRSHARGGGKIETPDHAMSAIIEVTKYVCKPFEASRITPEIITELHDAFYRRQTKGSGGTMELKVIKNPPWWDWLAPLSKFDFAQCDTSPAVDGILAYVRSRPLLWLNLMRYSGLIRSATSPN
ncbi:unnamed protein product [marine sediment metagenome]|uniref:Replication protein n=1 Tax=marine sediment metagenome TaxID=412755 RepID=X1RB61_9ZZZZ